MPCRRSAAITVATMASMGLAVVVTSATAAPWRADEDNTRGWMLMSPQERIEHQARVRGFSDYDTCEAYRVEHHDLMVRRARERGLALPDEHWDFCSRLRRGARPE